jgi:uncharacterized protein (TIGR01777 family)
VRVLLTGGTGFIGSAVAAALRDRGDEVVVVSRSGPVTWDAVAPEVGRADAVVHLAGEPVAAARWTPERLARIRSSRVDTTERLARAAATAPRRPRVFVSASAVGYYGTRLDDARLDETAPAGDDGLARICAAWEQAAEPARSAGIRVVHPRIGIVLGAGGGALARMRTPFRWFVGGPLGSGKQWMSWIHRRDVVRALLLLVDREALSGPVNVVAPEPVTMEVFARSLGRSLGRPAALRVPAPVLRLALGDGLARTLLTGQRVVPRKLLDAGFAFDFPALDEALADLR